MTTTETVTKNHILFPHGPGSCLDSAGLLGQQHSSAQHSVQKWRVSGPVPSCFVSVVVGSVYIY